MNPASLSLPARPPGAAGLELGRLRWRFAAVRPGRRMRRFPTSENIVPRALRNAYGVFQTSAIFAYMRVREPARGAWDNQGVLNDKETDLCGRASGGDR